MLTSTLLNQLQNAALQRTEAVADLARRICEVPAPTGDERERAQFVASLWQERGYAPEIDEVGNVYVRRGTHMEMPIVMLLAHTDTVFPATVPIRVVRQDDILRGPGIGDNSVNVAAMMSMIDVLDELEIETDADIIAVADVGEEGLGNLLGARTAVERYREHLGAVLAVDGNLGRIIHRAVGSERWRIMVHGHGGHSYGAFGTPSAIHELGKIIAAIAELDVPKQPKTTFNVGLIEGGTSVNTIAASASAVLDMRSTDSVALQSLTEQVRAIVEARATTDVKTTIEVLGKRPAGELSQSHPLVQLAAEALHWLDIEPVYEASSTDANIPISLAIPALCIGITQGHGAHTLDEYLEIPPIGKGLAQLSRLCIETCSLIAVR